MSSNARRHVGWLICATLALVLAFFASSRPPITNNIFDVSWPNCGQATVNGQVGVVGVTGGLDFHSNKCLAEENGWFGRAALYMNTGYPDTAHSKRFTNFPRVCSKTASSCLAYNYGYTASQYAINYAASQGVHSSVWWLDVETDNSWSNSTTINRASLQGAIAALQRTPFVSQVGFYSYPAQWNIITGNWKNGFPVWVATGTTKHADAQTTCTQPSFTGGTTWLSQYTPKLDINYPCNNQFINSLFSASYTRMAGPEVL